MFLSLLFSFISCVNKNNYYTCNEIEYCREDRVVKPQNWTLSKQYQINEVAQTFVTKLNKNGKEDFAKLTLSFLSNKMVRFRIDPINESFSRYDVSLENYVVYQDILYHRLNYSIPEENDEYLLISSDNFKVFLYYSPFKAKIINSQNEEVLIINGDDTAILNTENDRRDVSMTFTFLKEGTKLSGLPSHTLPVNLANTKQGDTFITDPIRLFNTDINSYELNSTMAMYGAIPYLIGHKGDQSTSVFWLNPSETWVDIEDLNARFMSETDFIDIFVSSGTHQSVIKGYTELTGRPALQPLFSLGYHQSRWGYMTTNEVRSVSNKLDDNNIPLDAMWLDLDHVDDRKYFTFSTGFRDIQKLQKEFYKKGRKIVALVDPHLKDNDGYFVYKQAKDNDYLIRPHNGGDLRMNCWPGRSAWVDFMNPAAREWWATLFDYKVYKKSSKILFIWNDMNEPSVFDTKDGTLPRDAVHYEDHEEREVHNLYGHMMIASTYKGLLHRNSENRPFILTRSFFAGSQRYAVTWTGDNDATWGMLQNSIQMVVSFGISGMPYVGADVGGFFNSPNQELLTRWYQVGAWIYPFFRCHCHHLSDLREPYTLVDSNLDIVRTAIHERYSLLPLWYTIAYESFQTGQPIVRPLWWTYDIDNDEMVMLGDVILVAPLLKKGKKDMDITLPPGLWYSYRKLRPATGEMSLKGVDQKVPAFIKSGTIFATKPNVKQTTVKMRKDHYNLIVALDENMKAKGRLYIDDEYTFNYLEGEYLDIHFTFEDDTLTSELIGNYSTLINRFTNISIAGIKKSPSEVTNSGNNLEFSYKMGVLTIINVDTYVYEPLSIKITYPEKKEQNKEEL